MDSQAHDVSGGNLPRKRYPAHFRADARRAEQRRQARAGRKCERCERPFEARRADRKFCSLSCRVLAHRKRKLVQTMVERCRKPLPALLLNGDRRAAEAVIRAFHYTKPVPSGKSYYVVCGEALVVWSHPANYNAARHFLPGLDDPIVFELARLWAPDGHARNLLTMAISEAVTILKAQEPSVDLVMSYADPSAGHSGFVYRAASWIETGRSEEVRAWRRKDGAGPILPRRAFHSGSTHLNKPAIEALGYIQLKLPGKHRFVRPLSRRAKRLYSGRREETSRQRR
jgi:hypothetical protein